MKLMTYNILNGGECGLDKVVKTVQEAAPDFLTLNEANTFAENDDAVLRDFAGQTGFPYYELALSGESDYHVAVFSRHAWEKTARVTPLLRACIVTEFMTSAGTLTIASTHLSPFAEDTRVPEIERIMDNFKGSGNRIMMGDMNSLTKVDGYKDSMIADFNEMQLKKFTSDGRLCYDVTGLIKSRGYVDPAVLLNKNKVHTAPTSVNEKSAHSDMRLDYIYISEPLTPHIADYRVIKTPLTETASDHYPVVVELSLDVN